MQQNNKTGIFFETQTAESLEKAILEFEKSDSQGLFKKETIVSHARSFTKERFQKQFKEAVQRTIEQTNQILKG